MYLENILFNNIVFSLLRERSLHIVNIYWTTHIYLCIDLYLRYFVFLTCWFCNTPCSHTLVIFLIFLFTLILLFILALTIFEPSLMVPKKHIIWIINLLLGRFSNKGSRMVIFHYFKNMGQWYYKFDLWVIHKRFRDRFMFLLFNSFQKENKKNMKLCA